VHVLLLVVLLHEEWDHALGGDLVLFLRLVTCHKLNLEILCCFYVLSLNLYMLRHWSRFANHFRCSASALGPVCVFICDSNL